MSEFVSVPAIVVVCYLIGMCIKTFANEKGERFIPCICGICGGILGVVVFFTIPGFIGANNWITALAIGIVSGLASTGANQIYKQFTKE